MKRDQDKTKEQLTNELGEMRQQVNALKKVGGKFSQKIKRLKRIQEQYKSIFILAPDGIMTVDIKGVVTSCNKAYFELTGFSEEEIIDKHFTKLPLVRAKEIPEYVKIFSLVISGKWGNEPFEFIWIHKNGTSRQGEFRVSPLRQNGRITGIQVMVNQNKFTLYCP